MPEDENDLAYFLRNLPAEIPVTVIGAGSNLIVRDGGVPGVVIRLGRGFNAITVENDHRVRAGAALPDAMVARAAQEAGIAGLSFSARHSRLDRRRAAHERRRLWRRDQGRADRGARASIAAATCAPSATPTWDSPTAIAALPTISSSRGAVPGPRRRPDAIAAEMDEIKAKREKTQPRNRTGGSTFKNPPGQSAWKLIDAAGCRGLIVGGAQVSELHCNFLINLGDATAADIETLGETVRGG